MVVLLTTGLFGLDRLLVLLTGVGGAMEPGASFSSLILFGMEYFVRFM